MKIIDIINGIKKWHGTAVNEGKTLDVVKSGDVNQECTGIVTTCVATTEVIRQAIALGYNLVICHENIYYSPEDDEQWLVGNPVYEKKKRMIEDSGIVIWRDHDYIHGNGPKGLPRELTDYVFYGIMKELGWEAYMVGDIKKPLMYIIPERTVGQLAKELSEKLNLNGARIIGNLESKVSKVFIVEHVRGRDDREKILTAAAESADVMIPLEMVDWSLAEYVKDASLLGMNKAVISFGHFNFEEPAMKHMVEWIYQIVDPTIPVRYIQSGDMYNYVLR